MVILLYKKLGLLIVKKRMKHIKIFGNCDGTV